MCKALHGKGVPISFDPNVRKELVGNPAYFAAVREMIDMAAIFLPSEEDARLCFPVAGSKTSPRKCSPKAGAPWC